MTDSDFEREVDALSVEVIKEIGELKKRYYEEGFKDALKQLQAQQVAQSQTSMDVEVAASAVQPAHAGMIASDSELKAKIAFVDEKLEEHSARLAAVEQMLLTYGSRDEELKQIAEENRELVSNLKEKLSEISFMQSSIEEKVSQTPSSVSEKLDSLKNEVENLGNIVLESDSKVNRFERARKASVRRVERRFATLQKRLEDFKKVRRQLRKQGKRITTLSDGSVEKTSFKTTLKRLKAAQMKSAKPKTKAKARKATRKIKTKTIGVSGGRPRQVVIRSDLVKVVGTRAKAGKKKAASKTMRSKMNAKVKAHKPARALRSNRKSTISISSAEPTTVEINQKK